MTLTFILLCILAVALLLVGFTLVVYGIYLVATNDSRPDILDRGIMNFIRGSALLICSMPFSLYVMVQFSI